MRIAVLIILFSMCLGNVVFGQRIMKSQNAANGSGMGGRDMENGTIRGTKREDGKSASKTEKEAPVGIRTWIVNQYNEIDSVAPDTLSPHFQNENYTEGPTFRYNSLGNMGSPRLSRIYTDRSAFTNFIFAQPYDFFIRPMEQFHFTNTLSPITNITYHETTDSENGEDHIHAKYAVNIDKTAGIGFHLNYLYGRGYYQNQNTSQFGATLYGSYIKPKYNAHIRFFANYLKTAENGGIENDDYISHPENFPSKITTKDIPTMLDKTWNKMHIDGVNLTHCYNLGYYKTAITIKPDTGKTEIPVLEDDSVAKTASKGPDSIITRTFIPVTRIVHTLNVQSNERNFVANRDISSFFANNYLKGDSTRDEIRHTSVSNLLAVELREGFNKWAVSGVRLFFKHEFDHYKLPSANLLPDVFNENRITLGGMLLRREGKIFNYNALAQTSSYGNSWGEFELKGNGFLNVPIGKDTVGLHVYGYAVNQRPTFFYRHYQSKYVWWDNNGLSNQFTTRIGATLNNSRTKTRLSLDIQNIKNYTYFNSTYTKNTKGNAMATTVEQEGKNIQLVTLQLNQDFRLGILHWENELVYQKVSHEEILPLPEFFAYSNLYILFRIAKVLRVELGADGRYYTAYYAPTYNPALGMFTNQPQQDRVKIGDYPVADIYANFHLKHTRFYIMYSHVNYSSDGGKAFNAPHYPINPGMLKLGLSWNFFN